MTAFGTLSALAGLAITSAQAIGEGITDPVIIIWFMIAATSSDVAFCVISNAIAGFIARPRRTRARSITETSVIAGCLATLIAIAFHDSLWSACTAVPLTTAALISLPVHPHRSERLKTVPALPSVRRPVSGTQPVRNRKKAS